MTLTKNTPRANLLSDMIDTLEETATSNSWSKSKLHVSTRTAQDRAQAAIEMLDDDLLAEAIDTLRRCVSKQAERNRQADRVDGKVKASDLGVVAVVRELDELQRTKDERKMRAKRQIREWLETNTSAKSVKLWDAMLRRFENLNGSPSVVNRKLDVIDRNIEALKEQIIAATSA